MGFPTGLLMDFLTVLLVLMQDSLDFPQEFIPQERPGTIKAMPLALVQDFLDSPQERPGTFKVMSRVLESPQELITGVLESPQELIMGTQDLLMDPTEFVGLFQ